MKISVIGASGNVGSAVAFYIASRHLADEIVLIDTPRPDMVAFHAWDINTAVTGHDMIVRAGDYPDMGDSDIVIIAAGSARIVQDRKEVLPQNLAIIQDIAKKLKQYCPDAIIITASNPVDSLNYAMFRCSDLDRRKIIGYTYNDSIRFRMRLGQELGVSSSRIEAYVIGEHGESLVQLFSHVHLDGKPVTFTEAIKEKMRRQVAEGQQQRDAFSQKTGRTAAWTTAVGLEEVVYAITGNTGKLIPCSVPLQGEYGCQNMSMSVPVILGKGGVKQIVAWPLAPDEQALLTGTIGILKPTMEYVDGLLHLCSK
jgi:malate dehydrogenase